MIDALIQLISWISTVLVWSVAPSKMQTQPKQVKYVRYAASLTTKGSVFKTQAQILINIWGQMASMLSDTELRFQILPI